MNRLMILLIGGIIVSSCNPDLSILHPFRNKPESKPRTLILDKDTFKVTFTMQPFQPLFYKYDGKPAQLPYNIRSFVFESSSKNQINAWMVKPNNKPADITLIYLHGSSGNMLTNFSLIKPMIDEGFQIFMIDYSGFGLSNGRATRLNTLSDALSSVDFVKRLPMIKGTKLVIYGQSYGGHLAGVVGTMKQNDIDGLVIESAFTSHHDVMTGFIGWLGRIRLPELFSAKDSIPNFHKPLLIIHSSDDPVVPYQMGKTMFELANQPKFFIETQGGHVCGPRLYSSQIASQIRFMFTNYD